MGVIFFSSSSSLSHLLCSNIKLRFYNLSAQLEIGVRLSLKCRLAPFKESKLPSVQPVTFTSGRPLSLLSSRFLSGLWSVVAQKRLLAMLLASGPAISCIQPAACAQLFLLCHLSPSGLADGSSVDLPSFHPAAGHVFTSQTPTVVCIMCVLCCACRLLPDLCACAFDSVLVKAACVTLLLLYSGNLLGLISFAASSLFGWVSFCFLSSTSILSQSHQG